MTYQDLMNQLENYFNYLKESNPSFNTMDQVTFMASRIRELLLELRQMVNELHQDALSQELDKILESVSCDFECQALKDLLSQVSSSELDKALKEVERKNQDYYYDEEKASTYQTMMVRLTDSPVDLTQKIDDFLTIYFTKTNQLEALSYFDYARLLSSFTELETILSFRNELIKNPLSEDGYDLSKVIIQDASAYKIDTERSGEYGTCVLLSKMNEYLVRFDEENKNRLIDILTELDTLYDEEKIASMMDPFEGYHEFQNEGKRILALMEKLDLRNETNLESVLVRIESYNHHYQEFDGKIKELLAKVAYFKDKNNSLSSGLFKFNPVYPFFIYEEIASSSKLNSIFQLLKFIHQFDFTIEEFANDPTNCIKDYFKKLGNYNYLNKLLKEKDVLNFIDSSLSNQEEWNQYFIKAKAYYDFRKTFGILSLIDGNETLYSFMAYYLQEKVKEELEEYHDLYFADVEENKETIKNLLVLEENQDYLTCTVCFNFFISPFTGEKMEKVSYQKLIDSSNKIQFVLIIKQLLRYHRTLTRGEFQNKDLMEQTLKDLMEEIISKLDVTKLIMFEDVARLFDQPLYVYYEQKLARHHKLYQDNMNFQDYMIYLFNKSCQKHLDKNNICRVLGIVKAMDQYYKDKTKLEKVIKPESWVDKAIVDGFKEKLLKRGLSKKTLDRILASTIKMTDIYQEYISGAIKAYYDDPALLEKAQKEEKMLEEQERLLATRSDNKNKFNNADDLIKYKMYLDYDQED